MASYIVKSKNIDFDDKKYEKITIGRFYSNDRFYTLLSEYLDKNLNKQSKLCAWIIKVLFRSSNFKHDPGIANGIPLSVKLFDWFCILCLVIALILSLGVIGTLIPFLMKIVKGTSDDATIEALKNTIMATGFPAIFFWIPAILWLIIYFAIRRKNKPLTLQAFVEKKITWCIKLKFLIKNIKNFKDEKKPRIYLLENFEAQGASGPRWLNLQLINLICSIFPSFNYSFRFEDLSEADFNELKEVVRYDFRKLELIEGEKININEWVNEDKTNLFSFSKGKETKNTSNIEQKIVEQTNTKEVKLKKSVKDEKSK